MTPVQKEAVYKLRLQGLGYKAIARELLISVDAVKSYCKRHHLIGPPEAVVLGYKCGHKNVESVKLKARKDVSNIEQAVYRRIQSDGR